MSFPVFVVGVGRSGTTLLSLMMDTHSQLAIPYESNFFVRYFRALDKYGDLNRSENRLRLVDDFLAEPYLVRWEHRITRDDLDLDACTSLAALIDQVYTAFARKSGKTRWGDKSPGYTAHMDLLHQLFPEARFVHIYRDGRDVARSSMSQDWWGTCDLLTHLKFWETRQRKALADLAKIPDHLWIKVSYESLIADPEPWLRRICSLLELEFEEPMLAAYGERAREKVGKRVEHVHKNLSGKPDPNLAFKWKRKMSPADQALCWQRSGDLLAELGYESGCTHHWKAPFRRMWHLGDFFYKAAWRKYRLLTNGGKKSPRLFSKVTTQEVLGERA